jgi:hypothetical protein
MPIDFGTALMNVGNVWANALSEEEKMKVAKEKLAFDQMQSKQRLALDQGQLDLGRDQEARMQAKQIFDKTLALVDKGPSQPISREQFQGLDQDMAPAFFKELPQPHDVPAALGLDGKPAEGTPMITATEGEQYYQFQPGESERARIAALGESGRAARNQAALYQRELDRQSREGIAGANRDAAWDRTQFLEGGRNSRFDRQPITIDLGGFVLAPSREQIMNGDVTNAPQFNKTMTPTQTAALGSKLGDMSDYASRIKEALDIGRKTNWAGTGIVEGRVKGSLGGFFANSQDFRLRALVSDLFAENAHQRFGGALTAQEIERAKGYLTEVTDDPRKIESNLQLMYDIITPKLERGQDRLNQLGAPGRGGQAMPNTPQQTPASSGYQRYLQRNGGQ